MRPISLRTPLAGLALGLVFIAAACSSSAATQGNTVAGATATIHAPGATPTAPAGAMALTLGKTADASIGDYLTGQNGMTLYVLTTDTPDTTSCSGTCATNWPPLTVAGNTAVEGPTGATGTFGTINRSDGTIQVTYNHMPLYYYIGDSAAGDTIGQGKLGVWFVAPVSGTKPGSKSSSGY